MTITIAAVPGRQVVDLRIATTAGDAEPVTVTRTAGGLTSTVRGGAAVTGHGGGLVLVDYEIPYRTPLVYRAVCGGESVAATVVVDEPGAWLRSVLNPRTSVPVGIAAMHTVRRPARATYHRPVGRRNAVAVSDVREGAQGQITLVTWDETGAAALERLLDSNDVLLLTGPASWRHGPLYCQLGDVDIARPGGLAEVPERLWTAPFVEVDPPPGTVPPPAQTWGELKGRGVRWADLKGIRWVDVAHPPPAAAALRAGWP